MAIAPVVIVHDERDGDVPERLEARIQAAGYPTWRSGRDVLVGEYLHGSVSEQLSRGGPVILCLGLASVGSGMAKVVGMAALQRGLDCSKLLLIPVRCAPADSTHLLQTWANPQVADCVEGSFEHGVQAVLKTLFQRHPLPSKPNATPPGPTQPSQNKPGSKWTLKALLPHYLTATREAHRYIPVVGGDARMRLDLTLEKVFVPLRAVLHRSLREEKATWHFKQLRTGKSGASAKDSGRSGGAEQHAGPGQMDGTGGVTQACLVDRDIDLEQAFAIAHDFDLHALIILGDPGSGKTTLLKHLLVRCIDQKAEGMGLPEGLVPVMLPLRNLRDLTAGLDSFIQTQLDQNPHLGLPKGFGKALLERGKLLFLLDGLDEVASAEHRIQVRGWIEEAHAARPNCWFAVTSRYAGYQGEAQLNQRFLQLNVRPFEDDQAERFVRQWYCTIEHHLKGRTHTANVSAEEQARELWTRLSGKQFQSRKLRELVGNPLMLTILCYVHRVEGALPKRRGLLYESCVKVLLEHWHRTKKLDMPFEGREARRALLPVAWWMHQEEGRTQATAGALELVLAAPLIRLRREPSEARAFLETIRDRSGLLVGWDVDSFGFLHLSFQEYLAALEAWSEDRIEEVVAHFGESWWKEVTLQLLAIPDKPVFEPFMRALVKREAFVAHPALVSLCLEESFEISATPFIEVLESGDDRPWQRDYASLLALKGMKDGRIVETCQLVLRKSPHRGVRDLARELLSARGGAVSKRLEAGDPWVHPSTGLEFVYVPPGSFMMGGDRYDDEKPVHPVSFEEGYWIGKYPVTNAQYERFMTRGNDQEPEFWKDSQFNGPDQPVVGVDWNDAMAFCQWASDLLLNGGELPPGGTSGILLPSEAAWEYAARGPENRRYPWGNDDPSPTLANYDESTIGRTSPVGQYPEGASWVGAQDMAGNVLEWCADCWHDSYQGAPEDGSPWSTGGEGSWRVVRSGGWFDDADWLRSAYRSWWHSGYRFNSLGFRVVLAAPVFGNLG